MKYRSKIDPVCVVQADQWRPGKVIDSVGIDENNNANVYSFWSVIRLVPGDWIVHLLAGGKQVMRNDDFIAEYEPIEE